MLNIRLKYENNAGVVIFNQPAGFCSLSGERVFIRRAVRVESGEGLWKILAAFEQLGEGEEKLAQIIGELKEDSESLEEQLNKFLSKGGRIRKISPQGKELLSPEGILELLAELELDFN